MTPFVKVKFTDEWKAFDFQDQQVKTNPLTLSYVPALRNVNRGVSQSTYRDIIRDIVPVIEKIDGGLHAYIAQMYKDLTVKNNVADLCHGDDPDPAEADV